ncbi:adenylate/guanylate cyclase domain-containing protein [Rhizobium lentis]|uniref:Adenylate cyclase n=1 Tax=Rhizobium lentis TaxID=1138194 RepID=A0A7W8UQK8_9HYPH|nr:adenylate/guanylate cyclase domain-containing protein [Rhizobium lentis]MBB5551077.1 adenylate cyclase [Rhizobium lentis]MBB5561612.1 adenylate cyclase [Rhizobium lentis]MBB5568196.1 adenylate cyclase [Rhizobium lentis]
MQRRLSAILLADVVGYTRLMEIDDITTLSRLKSMRHDLVDPCIAAHNGRIVKLMGDGMLVEFASVADAVRCATEVQRGVARAESQEAEDRRLVYRIGINLGYIVVDGDDIYGDGVNVAARLQSLADPGGVAIAGIVREHIGSELGIDFEDFGQHSVKNHERPIQVHMARFERPWRDASSKRAVAATAAEREGASIAVLPFTNMSGDPEQEYFSDGITEDIITDLAKVSALSVTARNSSFIYKGRSVDMKQVGRELGVRYVLEGSVRKAGTKVRIAAQLINGADGRHVWAERYDRDLEDIFTLQDEISKHIVDALKVRLLTKELETITKRGTENPEAYQTYLMGRSFFNRGHESRGIKAARRLFAKAIDLDPLYARAYAGLADCDSYLLLANDPTATYDNIIDNADRALELDPGLSDAHASRGIAMFTKGLRAEAEAEFELALERDPTSFEANFFRGRNCHAQGQFERARGFYERTIVLKPDDYRAWDQLRAVHVSLGHQEEAAQSARECLRLIEREIAAHPDEPILLCYGGCLLADLGEMERGASWASRAAAIAKDDLRVLYNLACCYAKLGKPSEAIACLERQASGSPAYVASVTAWMKKDSDLDPLRDHPRYLALAGRMEAQPAAAKE